MINYDYVSQAIKYYDTCGFKYIEAPWLINYEAVNATLPSNRYGIGTSSPYMESKYLPGSAEQSFIQMMIDGSIKPGKYCAAGPCYRDERVDKLHSITFFKVELIIIGMNDEKSLNTVLIHSRHFMEQLSDCDIDILKTNDGFDLLLNGIEVGSYGIRSYKNHKWVYGTGLALPRFDLAIKKYS